MPDTAKTDVLDLRGFEKRYLEERGNAPTGWNTREWAEKSPELRMLSFFSAGVEDEKVLQGMRRALMDSGNESEFIRRAHELLAVLRDKNGNAVWDPTQPDREGVPREKWHKDVRNLTSAARLRLIFRTQRELATGYADFLRAFEPEMLRRYPGWRLKRQDGAKIKRQRHVDHEEEVHLKVEFPFWMFMNAADIGGFQNPFPPLGFNSWMYVQQVSYEECVALGLLREGEEPPMPGPEYAPWLSDIPAAMRQKSVAALGEQSRIELKRRMEAEGVHVEAAPQEADVWEVRPPEGKRPEPDRETQARQAAEEERRRELQRERRRREEEARRAKEDAEKQEEERKRQEDAARERLRRLREEKQRRDAERNESMPEPTTFPQGEDGLLFNRLAALIMSAMREREERRKREEAEKESKKKKKS